MTTEPVPASPIPTQGHRIAADRAMRLAAHAGPDEALEFYDELSAPERRIVFTMLALAAGKRRLTAPPPSTEVPWWTGTELEAAHKAVACGSRAPWLMVGARLWNKQRRTARPAPTASTLPREVADCPKCGRTVGLTGTADARALRRHNDPETRVVCPGSRDVAVAWRDRVQ